MKMTAPRFPSVTVNCSIGTLKSSRTCRMGDAGYECAGPAGDETFCVKGSELALFKPDSTADFDMSPYITTVINGIGRDQLVSEFKAMGFVMPMHSSGGGGEKVAIQIFGLVTVKNNGSEMIYAGDDICWDAIKTTDREWKIRKRGSAPGNAHSRHVAVLRRRPEHEDAEHRIVGKAMSNAQVGFDFTLSINIM